jgi:hypothetical protein
VTWLDDQSVLRRLLLAEAPDGADVDRLGGTAARWLVYRRMVRSRFADVLAEGFERLRALAGDAAFDGFVDHFLAARPPASPYLRDVPGEFLRFLQGEGGPLLAALPAFALDLARFECAELEAAHVSAREENLASFDMQLETVLVSSARLLELDPDLAGELAAMPSALVRAPALAASGKAVSPSSFAVLVYRDPKTHEVESLELTPMAARILRGIQRGEGALVDILKATANEAGVAIDSPFVEALGTLLADLVERGVIAGSRARADGEPRIDSP